MRSSHKAALPTLVLGAFGVVFGDIGTSPLYALRQCFAPEHGMTVDPANIIGICSLLLWTLIIIVCVKYIAVVMRADNNGEGGILALVTLVGRRISQSKGRTVAIVAGLGILGAALLYSDGIITPAISVLSAVEGLQLISPDFKPWIIPLSLVVLVLLFPFQSRGTSRVGGLFGPIIVLWFAAIGTLGVVSIVGNPEILYAINPYYAISFAVRHGLATISVLGSVFLAVTGAEVLYADMGHFGKKPIRIAWFALAFPALVLNYLGQGAQLLKSPDGLDNLFFRLSPSWFSLPLVILATAATVIASQAVISGAFSLARQSVQLGYWPRMRVLHTSNERIGQVYVPLINRLLLVGTVALVLGFKASDNLANAYGIAVSATMLLTTCLMIYLARASWKVPLVLLIPLGILMFFIDAVFFAANATKFLSGGWIVVLFAAAIFLLMKTWMDGRHMIRSRMETSLLTIEEFIASLKEGLPIRVKGTAVFLAGNPKGVPLALLHNLKHNRVLHGRTVILSVQTTDSPTVDPGSRAEVTKLEMGIWRIVLHYGFSETPDIPAALQSIQSEDLVCDPNQTTYFLGRESLVFTNRGGRMSGWRKRLFGFMSHNALDATSFFHLPPARVVVLGAQTEL